MLLSMFALLALGVLSLLAPPAALAQADKPAAGLDLQHARTQFVEAKGKQVFYTKQWDLSDLPRYEPKRQVSGTIRMWGSTHDPPHRPRPQIRNRMIHGYDSIDTDLLWDTLQVDLPFLIKALEDMIDHWQR